MKAPPFNFANITKSYKTDWFVTDNEIVELRDYIYQNAPMPSSDIYSGMYMGIHKDDFQNFLNGERKYRAIAVCIALYQKITG